MKINNKIQISVIIILMTIILCLIITDNNVKVNAINESSITYKNENKEENEKISIE